MPVLSQIPLTFTKLSDFVNAVLAGDLVVLPAVVVAEKSSLSDKIALKAYLPTAGIVVEDPPIIHSFFCRDLIGNLIDEIDPLMWRLTPASFGNCSLNIKVYFRRYAERYGTVSCGSLESELVVTDRYCASHDGSRCIEYVIKGGLAFPFHFLPLGNETVATYLAGSRESFLTISFMAPISEGDITIQALPPEPFWATRSQSFPPVPIGSIWKLGRHPESGEITLASELCEIHIFYPQGVLFIHTLVDPNTVLVTYDDRDEYASTLNNMFISMLTEDLGLSSGYINKYFFSYDTGWFNFFASFIGEMIPPEDGASFPSIHAISNVVTIVGETPPYYSAISCDFVDKKVEAAAVFFEGNLKYIFVPDFIFIAQKDARISEIGSSTNTAFLRPIIRYNTPRAVVESGAPPMDFGCVSGGLEEFNSVRPYNFGLYGRRTLVTSPIKLLSDGYYGMELMVADTYVKTNRFCQFSSSIYKSFSQFIWPFPYTRTARHIFASPAAEGCLSSSIDEVMGYVPSDFVCQYSGGGWFCYKYNDLMFRYPVPYFPFQNNPIPLSQPSCITTGTSNKLLSFEEGGQYGPLYI